MDQIATPNDELITKLMEACREGWPVPMEACSAELLRRLSSKPTLADFPNYGAVIGQLKGLAGRINDEDLTDDAVFEVIDWLRDQRDSQIQFVGGVGALLDILEGAAVFRHPSQADIPLPEIVMQVRAAIVALQRGEGCELLCKHLEERDTKIAKLEHEFQEALEQSDEHD